jgi:fused signal recognition particle receptor
MALGFIKKIFSFGKEDKPQAAPAPEAAVALEEATPAVEHSPAESAPAFTSETVDEPDLSTSAPADTEHAGEPGELSEPAVLSEYLQKSLDDDRARFETLRDQEENLPASIIDEIIGEEEDEPVETVEDILRDEDQQALEIADEQHPAPDVVEPIAPAEPVLPAGFTTASSRLPEPVAEPERRRTWIERLRQGLARTSQQLSSQITSLFTKRKLDEETLQDLEDLLIQADLGVETALRITDTLSSERYGKDVSGDDVSRIMAGEITKVLAPVAKPLELDLSHKPHVILVVGVNGTGKTTTIGKLAAKLSRSGLKVMLAAGDTFRAAAIEQLHIWAQRTGAVIVSSKLGSDAAGLAFEAYEKAKQSGHDVLIIDTAGRLQNKVELMAELEKIVRVLGKLDPDAPHTVLQTLDATTGQNALNQVEIFRNIAGVSGLVMTKLDGTARGGILVAISAKHKLPIYFIGVGEGVDDLEPFNASDFAEAIAGLQSTNK